MSAPTLLIVSRAPVPGRAKTRLASTVGDRNAAELACLALLDTVAAAESSGLPIAIAMTDDLRATPMHDELAAALRPHRLIEQRGAGFADRLANAHRDADSGWGVVQIGMDTPQADAGLLCSAAEALRERDAVLGMATDGGWWLLGVRDSRYARCLRDVAMSTEHTGVATRTALRRIGANVGSLPTLLDVDTWDDALRVASGASNGRFVTRVRELHRGALV